MSFVFADYNIRKGLALRGKSKVHGDIIGIITNVDINPFGSGKIILYELTVIKTGRKLIYNLNELSQYWEYSDSLQVLYGN